MLLPFLFGAAVLIIVPGGITLSLAFAQYDGLAPPRWVGLHNFRSLFVDPLTFIAISNTSLFVALTVPLRVLAALVLALLLHRPARGVGIYRAAVYLPTIIPGVAYALIWLWVLNPVSGPLNLVLAALGMPTPAWLAESRTALPALVAAGLFQLGESFVVLLAGLHAIPRDYYQAALIDGADRRQILRTITLPLLAPWLMLVVMRELIVSVQSSFTPALLMTGGGPYYATLFLPQLIYETAFDRFRFGDAAALTLITLLGLGLGLLLLHRAAGGWGYADET